jgi:hypothetical protein
MVTMEPMEQHIEKYVLLLSITHTSIGSEQTISVWLIVFFPNPVQFSPMLIILKINVKN